MRPEGVADAQTVEIPSPPKELSTGTHLKSQSRVVNLPSSLTTLLPLALESSSYLPVSVCGTGTAEIHTAFLAIFHPGLRY